METEGHKANRRRPKNKSKRFLHNAKGFAKQGIYGRGTHIESEEFSYFLNIMDAMKADQLDLEARVNMASNVFDQTEEKEIHLASNQVVSKVLEDLIGFVDSARLERFFTKFGDSLRPICSDRFASHVLQKMVEIAFLRGLGKAAALEEASEDVAPSAAKRAKSNAAQSEEEFNLTTEYKESHREQCRAFVLRIAKFMLNNLEDFVWDSCANHIMRTAILCLAGILTQKNAISKGGADLAKNCTMYNVPEEWHEVMKEFPQRLELWPQFEEFPYQEHSSALLSVICIALKRVDKNLLKHFGKKIIQNLVKPAETPNEEEKNVELENETQSDNKQDVDPQLPKVFQYQTAIVLLETLISVAGKKLLIQIYAFLFKGRIAWLAQEHLTNFSVQRLLETVKEPEDFQHIFNEVLPLIEELLKIGHTGVVASLSSACLRLSCKQAQLIGGLQNALHIAGDKEKSQQFFNCLVKLKPYEIMQGQDPTGFVHLHGSLIIQHLLQFNKPIFLVNCMLELPPAELSNVFNTPNGSHIVDAFMKSKYIGEKSRERLIRLLDGFYVDLAITRHGSRVLEQCFHAAQDAQKVRMVKELANKINMLNGSPFGRLIFNKYRINTYKLTPNQWQASFIQQQQEQKEQSKKSKTSKATNELFKDIIA